MARPLWGQGLVPPMGGFSKAAPLGCGFFSEIEGENLDADQVRSSIARRLGWISAACPRPTARSKASSR